MVSAPATNPRFRSRLWRAKQPVPIHHLVGYQHVRGGAGLHQSAQLDAGHHQRARQRHLLLCGFHLDELSPAFLPRAFTVICFTLSIFTAVPGAWPSATFSAFTRRWANPSKPPSGRKNWISLPKADQAMNAGTPNSTGGNRENGE